MSVQFKVKDSVGDDKRREILDALRRVGFAAHSLFPGQKRPRLASIFTVSKADAKDVKALRAALADYSHEIEYIEAAPERGIKA